MKARYLPPKLSEKEWREIYHEASYDAVKSLIGAVLYILHLRGWHKDRIQKFYSDILSIMDMPEILGKPLNDYEVRAFISEKYDIDFSKLKMHFKVIPEEKVKKIAQIKREEGLK